MVLLFHVAERPILRGWDLTGPREISPREVRDRVTLVAGRPLDRAALARSAFAIDSMYRDAGYYGVRVATRTDEIDDGVRVTFDVHEGNRIVISQVLVDGNTHYSDNDVVGAIASKPEGFFWFRSGKYEDDRIDEDLRSRLPAWYGDRGFVDFQVTGDTLIPDPTTGKATLRLTVDEGQQYRIGTVEITGNSRFSTEELASLLPFVLPSQVNTGQAIGTVFKRSDWESARQKVEDQYANNGYIRAAVVAQESRRSSTGTDSLPRLDLRLAISEGPPAYVNKVNIVGNDVTHERVIREAIIILPGQLFNRQALIRSYQNISNLNFFEQPLPIPDIKPLDNGDVDVTFTVAEKRTGNINFGASVGQGTGLGGFLGLEEPNLFGRGKRGRLQWQFGRNINDFQLSYSDPAVLGSRISSTLSIFNSRQRFIVGDLGRRQQEGGSLQVGLPWLGSRYSRVFASYGFQRIRFTEGSADLQARYRCSPCSRSTLGLSFLRDTRIGLPFPVGGSLVNVGVEQNGGILGGTGDYQKVDLETRWYTPLGGAGGQRGFGGGVQFTLGITAKSGFIFGNPGGFFTELYSMGGVQFGVPLRGYDEFSITPKGYDPYSASSQASADAFGKSYAAFTVEAGMRISQSVYLNTFFDAGNVYGSVRAWDPTRLYRGAGVGAALVSPLGPIGVDLGYGFDKTDIQGRPAPGWKLHFRLGNFF